MAGLLSMAVYRMYWYGNEYFRLADANWYCLVWQSGLKDISPLSSLAWLEHPADEEACQHCEEHFQLRVSILPELRRHWHQVEAALRTTFTDEELLRLDSIFWLSDSYSKEAIDFSRRPLLLLSAPIPH